MEHSSKIVCPGCNKPMLVAPQGCMVSAKMAPETASESARCPKPSRLHAMALTDMVELGLEADLRQALLQISLARNAAWVKESGREDKLGPSNTFLHSKLFNCPHCSAELNLLLDVTIAGVVPVTREPGERAATGRIRGADHATIEFVDMCRSVGALKAFEEAMQEQVELKKLQGVTMSVPKFIEQAFVVFLRTAQRSFPRSDIFRRINSELGKQNIQYWQSNGVGLITLDDQIFRFVPACLFENKQGPQSPLQQKLLKSGNGTGAPSDVWVKSRFGYVPASQQLFLSELRQRSKGAFATPSQ